MLENAIVELNVDVDRWSAGTVGTVVSELSGGALIEVSDEHGKTLDMIEAPHTSYRVLTPAKGHPTEEFASLK